METATILITYTSKRSGKCIEAIYSNPESAIKAGEVFVSKVRDTTKFWKRSKCSAYYTIHTRFLYKD